MSEYPKRYSDVEIVFLDGTVETIRCGFGAGIARYLAEQAGATGILSLLCGGKAYAYPVSTIRSWTITELETQA